MLMENNNSDIFQSQNLKEWEIQRVQLTQPNKW